MAEEQHQVRRPRAGDGPIKYKDVFEMSGEMAEQPISPRDAAAMRSAENYAFGKTIKGGPASIMLSAATMNVEAGLVAPDDGSGSGSGSTSYTNDMAGEIRWHESQPAHEVMESVISGDQNRAGEEGGVGGGITIGEALEAAAEAIGDKPVDRADAAAIQAAETTAGLGSGLGAEAQAAATINARMMYDEDKTKLSEIIGGAENMLTDDKPATRKDAEKVGAAELRGDAEGVIGARAGAGADALHHHVVKHSTTPGGVAEAVAAAARINEPDK